MKLNDERHTFRTNNETATLLCTSVYRLDDVDELLLILEDPVELVVVSGTEITHYVFVAEEEHDRAGVVKLVHLVEVRNLVDVTDVDDGEGLDFVCDLVENLILAHALFVPVAAEADANEALFFGEDGLVDMPAGVEMGDDDGAHGYGWLLFETSSARFCDCVSRKMMGILGGGYLKLELLEAWLEVG